MEKRLEIMKMEKGFLTINANENGKVEVEYTGTAAEKICFCNFNTYACYNDFKKIDINK